MFLLDTNHCSHALLGNAQVLNRLASLGDESIATCTIVKGELIDMAARSQQKQANLALVQRFLVGLAVVPVLDTTGSVMLWAEFVYSLGGAWAEGFPTLDTIRSVVGEDIQRETL